MVFIACNNSPQNKSKNLNKEVKEEELEKNLLPFHINYKTSLVQTSILHQKLSRISLKKIQKSRNKNLHLKKPRMKQKLTGTKK